MWRNRLSLSLTLMAALAACAVPVPGSPSGASAPGDAGLGAATPMDGQSYPDARTYRLQADAELPITGITADSTLAGYAPARAIDRDLATQWASGGYRNPTAWAAVALSASATLSSVSLKTGPSPAGTSYDVQVSADGAAWTTVASALTNTTWGMETKALPAGTTGRYVRIFWRNSITNPQLRFSIFELAVNGTSGPTPSPTPTPVPTPTPTPTNGPSAPPSPTGSPQLLLPAGTSSGPSYPGLEQRRAIDGDLATQWMSGAYQPTEVFFQLNWGNTDGWNFSEVRLKTGALPTGVFYRFEVSNDNLTWQTASANLTNTTWGLERKLISGSGRYLRIRFFNRPTNPIARFSIYEIHPYGTPLGAADLSFPIAAIRDVRESAPRVVYNANANEYLVVWAYDFFDPTTLVGEGRVRGRRITPTGAWIGSDFDVAVMDQVRSPDVVFSTAANAYTVTWEGRVGSGSDIYAQRVGPTGGLLGGALNLTTALAADMYQPRIALNGATNECLVAWNGQDGAVRGQRFGATGTPVGGLLTLSPGGNLSAVAASASANSYLLALDGVTLRRFSATGAPLGGPLTLDSGEGDERRPALTFNWRANQYLVTWFRELAGQTQILSQRLTDTGAPVGSSFPVVDAYASQRTPALTFGFAPNSFLMVWTDSRNEDILSQNPFRDDVYGRILE